jgi:membrane fusion protein (multidrug efflux system)
MFARARLAQSRKANAYLVPQVALSRDPKGNALVYVVSKDKTAEPRPVTAERTLGDAWVVTSGLKPGDQVITQGLGKIKPGGPIKPVPETAPQGGHKKAH